MPGTLTIGEFSRVTHLSVKTLRHYHEVGLLEPVHVDPGTGYRRYTTAQVPTAQVIRRFSVASTCESRMSRLSWPRRTIRRVTL